MKKSTQIALILLMGVSANAQNWKPTSTNVSFKIKMWGVTVEGTFQGFVGMVRFDPNNVAGSSIVGTVEANTLDTDNTLRNRHLKEKTEFFEVIKFPKLQLKSTKIEKTSTGYVGNFDLTIKNVTRNVRIPFTFTPNGDKATFAGNFNINRRDWSVGGGTLGMSNDVAVSLLLNATSQ